MLLLCSMPLYMQMLLILFQTYNQFLIKWRALPKNVHHVLLCPRKEHVVYNLWFLSTSNPVMSHNQLEYVNVLMPPQVIIHSPVTIYVVHKIGCWPWSVFEVLMWRSAMFLTWPRMSLQLLLLRSSNDPKYKLQMRWLYADQHHHLVQMCFPYYVLKKHRIQLKIAHAISSPNGMA